MRENIGRGDLGVLGDLDQGSIFSPGAILPGYQVEEELGRGRVARVYRATARSAERDPRNVCIKILESVPESNCGLRERVRLFERWRQLRHPNLVEIHEQGITSNSEPYLVMEYLEGETLEDRLGQRNPVSGVDALAIVQQIASAVQLLHGHGIVHGDLRPSNVFINRGGCLGPPSVKVLDFAVAKSSPETDRPAGTMGYMAPECRDAGDKESQSALPGSDVYSLGILLLEMLTVRVLHPAGAFWSESRAPVSATAMSAILWQMTSRDPLSRPPMSEMQEFLSQLQASLAADWLLPGPEKPAEPSCAEMTELVSRWIDKDLTEAESDQLHRHVRSCRDCADMAGQMTATVERVKEFADHVRGSTSLVQRIVAQWEEGRLNMLDDGTSINQLRQPAHPSAGRDTPRTDVPATASLRKLLDHVLPGGPELDAFCLDYFPEVQRRFTSGMDRVTKTNLLLERASRRAVWQHLSAEHPEAQQLAALCDSPPPQTGGGRAPLRFDGWGMSSSRRPQ